MSWNNNNNSQGNWGNNGNGNNNNWKSKNSNGAKPKKKSGAKKTMATSRDGVKYPCIVAWKANKQHGLVKMIASQRKAKNSRGEAQKTTYESKSGVSGEVWTCKIETQFGQPSLHTGFFNPQTNKLRIPDLNMVASTNTDYFGRSVFKK